MTRNGQPTQQRQVYIAQFFCRHCRFASVDVDGIRDHVSGHMLEAAMQSRGQRLTEQTQQLRERNLLYNPFHQLLPSTPQPNRGIPRNNCLQLQRGTHGFEAWRPPAQAQLIQGAQHLAAQQTQETSNASLMPLIDQLDHPIPVIIDLDSNQNGDPNQFDLTLKL